MVKADGSPPSPPPLSPGSVAPLFHSIARLVADGASIKEAAWLLGALTPQIGILGEDPAFIALVKSYKNQKGT